LFFQSGSALFSNNKNTIRSNPPKDAQSNGELPSCQISVIIIQIILEEQREEKRKTKWKGRKKNYRSDTLDIRSSLKKNPSNTFVTEETTIRERSETILIERENQNRNKKKQKSEKKKTKTKKKQTEKEHRKDQNKELTSALASISAPKSSNSSTTSLFPL
jgi:biopolymer transport protein ExbB/TolQ